MSEKCEAFPKQTGVLQKHNFNNKLDIFLTLVLAEKGMYKYNDKELSEMIEKRFEYGETDLFEWVEVDGEIISTKECVSKLNKQQTEIDDLKEENRQLRQFINKNRRLSVKELMNNANENELLKEKNEQLESENKKLQCINDQLEERLENSGIGIALKMDCDKNE